jgi:hypothetical protein
MNLVRIWDKKGKVVSTLLPSSTLVHLPLGLPPIISDIGVPPVPSQFRPVLYESDLSCMACGEVPLLAACIHRDRGFPALHCVFFFFSVPLLLLARAVFLNCLRMFLGYLSAKTEKTAVYIVYST